MLDLYNFNQRPGWRDYQSRLKQAPRRSRPMRGIASWMMVALTVAAAYVVFTLFPFRTEEQPGLSVPVSKERGVLPATASISKEVVTQAGKNAESDAKTALRTIIDKRDVQVMLSALPADRLISERIELPVGNRVLSAETCLNMGLQSYLLDRMDRKNSRFIGVVVMEADSGKILSLAGFDKTGGGNPCLRGNFPAASIFKIVTAAAAVDQLGYNADTQLHFTGYKHTLYRSQLQDKRNRYSVPISLQNAFAQSVNPVFGRIGAAHLGKEVLAQYAQAFGFNERIDFELPVEPSRLMIEDNAYNLAEIASGFNKETTLSPLHAAMMVSAVLNDGRMKAPTIIERIADENGTILYQSADAWSGQAMSANAAGILVRMMELTVQKGTGRRAFRPLTLKKEFSSLVIGAKTGSIDNNEHDARFDWFVGFARDPQGPALAIAALVAHEEFIGTRAADYVRMAVTHYFGDQKKRSQNRVPNERMPI